MVGLDQGARVVQFSRSFVVLGEKAGCLLGGIQALYAEPIIQRHCINFLVQEAELCLARSQHKVL